MNCVRVRRVGCNDLFNFWFEFKSTCGLQVAVIMDLASSSHQSCIHFSTDIDECMSAPCFNGGSCGDAVNGFECACVPGYSGSLCETGV